MLSKAVIGLLLLVNIVLFGRMDRMAMPVVSAESGAVILLVETFKISERLAHIIYRASRDYNLNPVFVATLIYTESSFNPVAISSKGYKGILQTPSMSGFVDVDIRHGLSIFKDKLRIANGDVARAVALYKGGDNLLAKTQANQMLNLYQGFARKSEFHSKN
jgi:soluble lytic murein transglycosylase-like protein